MADETAAQTRRRMPAIGKWRPAGALRDGWLILRTEHYEQTGVEQWLTIARAMQITGPLRVVSITLDGGGQMGCSSDPADGFEFFTRTPAEALRAAKCAASGATR